MFGKQRCYLCGGKLDNGRCTVCGLDNTRKQKKNYRLNESSLSPAGEKAVERAERDEQRPAKEESAGKRARRAERQRKRRLHRNQAVSLREVGRRRELQRRSRCR